ADRLVGALLDALPADVALVITADHGQVQVGPDGWRSLAPLHELVETYAGDGRFRHLHAKPGAAAELHERATDLHGADAWVFRREQLLD
ncbi:alkaline phosphatase family protein, partial [Klebsiella pneumoniae]|nr:alkaline phosphatase family protein [Klebsiella pneumoniae]